MRITIFPSKLWWEETSVASIVVLPLSKHIFPENKWKRNKGMVKERVEEVNKERDEVIITMIEGTERRDKYSIWREESTD